MSCLILDGLYFRTLSLDMIEELPMVCKLAESVIRGTRYLVVQILAGRNIRRFVGHTRLFWIAGEKGFALNHLLPPV